MTSPEQGRTEAEAVPSGFDVRNPPFDRLTHAETSSLLAALNVGYFRPGERIIERGQASDALHVIIKGRVEERDAETLHGVLGPRDSFDSRAVVHGAAGADFVAVEETLCHLVPRQVVLALVERNPAFAAFFYGEISRKLDAQSPRAGGVDSVLHARVREAQRGQAVFIDGAATVADAGQRMHEADTNALFVRDGGRVGVVTGMNLSKAMVLRRLPLETPIRDICHFDLVAVEAEDFIFEALILMTRHNKRRLVVRSGEDFIGFLEDIDILGLLAGNSQLIPSRIDRARSLDDLAAPARDIQAQVERLHGQGVRVDGIATITSDLNRRLFAKLFEMLAPLSIRDAGCLMLMGSEGRGEQTARTDQDNGLLLAHPVPEADLAAFRAAFSGALDQFGFPPCPGQIAVGNPLWSQPLDSFLAQIRTWVLERSPDAAMHLAIFFDAVAVGGDPQLLARAKSTLIDMMRGEDMLLSNMARLIESFDTPSLGRLGAFWATVGVGADTVDIKKSGTFPVVHGVRTLALDQGIVAVSTAGRVDGLVAAGVLTLELGRELVSVLRVFMEFRLRSQLAAIRRGSLEGEALVRRSELSSADRDILRDAFRITRQFREMIRHRYHLKAF